MNLKQNRARGLSLVASSLALCLLVAGCGGDGGDGGGGGDAAERTSVTIAMTEPPTLDFTTNTSGHISEMLLYNVLETLVKIDAEGQPQPLLAESWELSDDGLTYTFDLVEAQFHDGNPFTADDVVFSFERAMADDSAHPQKGHFAPVESVTALDDRTVEVTLSRPSNNWLFFMGNRAGAILSEESIGQMAANPVGTGPFRLRDWARGNTLTLEKNPDYWGDEAHLEDVVFRFIEDRNAVVNALLSGEVDLVPDVAARQRVQELEQNDQLTVEEKPTHEIVPIIINNSVEPLNDIRVRRALSHAIDKEAVQTSTYNGFAALIGSHVGPIDPWFVEDFVDHYPYDPQRSRELLAEAGYPEGVSLTIRVPQGDNHPRTAELIAGMAPEAGFDIDLQIDDLSVWLEEVLDPARAEYELTIAGFARPRSIHDYEGPFVWQYMNEELTRVLSEADAAVDQDERFALYEEAQRILVEDAVNVWIVQPNEVTALPAGLEGYPEVRIDRSTDMTQVRFAASG